MEGLGESLIFLHGCEIKSGSGRPGYEVRLGVRFLLCTVVADVEASAVHFEGSGKLAGFVFSLHSTALHVVARFYFLIFYKMQGEKVLEQRLE